MARSVVKGSVKPDVTNLGAFAASVVSAAGYQCQCDFQAGHYGKRCPNRMGGRDSRGGKVEIGIVPKPNRLATNRKEDWMAICDPCHKSCHPK